MYGWTTTPRRRSAPTHRRTSLALEGLETRFCPSTLSVTATLLEGNAVKLTGKVVDEGAGSVPVYFYGGVTDSIVTDTTGKFTATCTADSLGDIYAYAQVGEYDWLTAQTDITSNTPQIELSITQGAGRTVTLSGRVLDECPGGLPVSFYGAANGSTVTNPDGTFSVELQADSPGPVEAWVTDMWGQTGYSNTPVNVTGAAPVIEGFTACHSSGDVWVLHGKVLDASPGGLTVTFTGRDEFLGVTATTDEEGYFWLSICLPNTQGELVVATVTNTWGLEGSAQDCLLL